MVAAALNLMWLDDNVQAHRADHLGRKRVYEIELCMDKICGKQ